MRLLQFLPRMDSFGSNTPHNMSIRPQPNKWQCGPFALKHALLSLGVFADETDISRISRATALWGTDEVQLARAARRYDCKLQTIRRHRADLARKELQKFLQKGVPCLVCVYDWGHWITVVKSHAGRFIILDSNEKAVLNVLTWSELKNRWVYREQDKYDESHWITLYDLHPVVPRFRIRTKPRFSIQRVYFLRRPENRPLALHWDQFVTDLLTFCKPRTALSKRVMSMGEFFRRHEEMILNQVDYWHGEMERRDADRILKYMHFVADTYALVIPKDDEKRAISGITSILTLWAAGRYGVDEVYD